MEMLFSIEPLCSYLKFLRGNKRIPFARILTFLVILQMKPFPIDESKGYLSWVLWQQSQFLNRVSFFKKQISTRKRPKLFSVDLRTSRLTTFSCFFFLPLINDDKMALINNEKTTNQHPQTKLGETGGIKENGRMAKELWAFLLPGSEEPERINLFSLMFKCSYAYNSKAAFFSPVLYNLTVFFFGWGYL